MDGSKLRWRLKDGRINIKNSGEDGEDGQKGRNTMIIHVYIGWCPLPVTVANEGL